MKYTLVSTLVFLSVGIHAAESKLELRHREAKGVGYDKGYTTVDYLFLHQWRKPEFLFNLRGHVFNDGQFAGNVGMGYRHGIKDDAYMLGVNAFYDCRESKHLFTSQAGAGLEFLSKRIDVRMNGYLPLADKTYEKRHFERFVGNHIVIEQKVIGALPSAEMELGAALTRAFYLAAGPYYLFKQDVKGVHLGNSWGAKLRIAVDIDRYFTLGGVVTHDRIFETTIQGYLSLNIPLGGRWKKREPKRNLRKVPIFRNEIIPIEKKKRHVALYFGEEEDDLVDILFVNNMAVAGGDGSIEAPFSALKDAEAASEAGDVIYVFPGDGTPRNMEEGIILKDDQVIASAGAPLDLEEISIPPMTPGEIPVITNIHPDEPVITNPGDSNLEDFRIIQPWEYFFGDWNFYLGNNNPAGIDAPFDLGGGVPAPAPDGGVLGAAPPPDNGGDGDAVIVAPENDVGNEVEDGDAVIVAPADDNNADGNENLALGGPEDAPNPLAGVVLVEDDEGNLVYLSEVDSEGSWGAINSDAGAATPPAGGGNGSPDSWENLGEGSDGAVVTPPAGDINNVDGFVVVPDEAEAQGDGLGGVDIVNDYIGGGEAGDAGGSDFGGGWSDNLDAIEFFNGFSMDWD